MQCLVLDFTFESTVCSGYFQNLWAINHFSTILIKYNFNDWNSINIIHKKKFHVLQMESTILLNYLKTEKK